MSFDKLKKTVKRGQKKLTKGNRKDLKVHMIIS